jgi:AcrR family transcriptional regulator
MPEGRPLVERKQRRARERIVEAAFELFAERGFTEVTVTDIAERAEVGRTTFFRYFGDKQEVVFADDQLMLEALAAQQHDLSAPAPETLHEALRQLRAVVEPLCAAITKDPGHYAVHEELLARNTELHDRGVRKLRQFTEAMTGILLARGTRRELAVLAPQLALACYEAGHQLAGSDATALTPAVEAAFSELLQETARLRSEP